jgi:hypothetical protein
MHNQFKMYGNNVLTLAKLDFLKIRFPNLQSKMNSYRTETSVSKKLKGIKKAVMKKEISFEDYKNCLFNQKEYFHRQKVIRSHKHDIFTEEVKKKSLSWKDDKRYLLPNSTDTLAYGHVLVYGNC